MRSKGAPFYFKTTTILGNRRGATVISQEPNFRSLVATVDMFLFKFPNHPLLSLCVCTLTTRSRGCTRVRDLSNLNKKLLEKPFKESM